jgi:hypothetical protein
MARNRNTANLGIALGSGAGTIRDKPRFRDDHGGRKMPARRKASGANLCSPSRRTAAPINRQPCDSPTAMRWGSLEHFALS